MSKNVLEFERPIADLYKKIEELKHLSSDRNKKKISEDIKVLKSKAEELRAKIYSHLDPIQIIQLARHPERPVSTDYIGSIFTDFFELHGDRVYGDDTALVGGLAKIDGQPVMILGQQRGKTTKQNIFRNFGMSQPEAYRKALRLMRFAEKFNIPIISLIDTQGAYPGLGSEERSVAEAIAHNLQDMMGLRVPVIAIVIGEGGSGGALGIGVGNSVAMLKYSIYSVITPEGCAAILWRDAAMSPIAADNLGITSQRLLEMGVIDDVIDEPIGGAHSDPAKVYKKVKSFLKKELKRLQQMSPEELVEHRYQKFRKLGQFTE